MSSKREVGEFLRAGVEKAFAALYTVDYTPSTYHWLGRDAEPPECDGEFQDMECIEADGFITCYFSGPIAPLNRN